MRTVVDSREVAHLWAHQAQEHARNANGSVKFQERTIYSYGHHFPMATWVQDANGAMVVLMTTRTYSVTTAKHMGYVRRAVSHIEAAGEVFHVPLEWERDYTSAESIARYVESYRERINELGVKAAGSRKYAHLHFEALERLVGEANRFCERFHVEEQFVGPDQAEMERIRERAKEEIAAERARQREKAARIERENRERIEEWKQGRAGWIPAGVKRTYLRVQGEEVETSKGARFGVMSAMRGLALVRAVRERGEEWKRNGHTCKLGPYEVDRISAGGDVWAGCHYVEWDEIERVSGEIERVYAEMKARGVQDNA